MARAGRALRMMSLNLHVDWEDSPRPWHTRRAAVLAVLERERPHLIGTQEGQPHQIADLQEGLGDRYAWTGRGRDAAGDGEHMAVFHDTARLSRLAHGHFWLSDTPETPGSETWGGGCPRMVTWLRYRDLATGGELLAANTHFDDVSAYARARAAELLAARLDTLAPDVPRVVTGDFNVPAGDPDVHGVLLGRAGLVDTWDAAEQRDEAYGTFHGYGPPEQGGPRIDWILASRGTQVPAAAQILTRPDGRHPSDHLPITARLHLRTPRW